MSVAQKSICAYLDPLQPGDAQGATDWPVVPVDAGYGTALGVMLRAGRREALAVDASGTPVGRVSFGRIRDAVGSPERLKDEILSRQHALPDDPNVRRHFARYHFAKNFIARGKNVLDCACGIGYGSAILGQTGAMILGVDLSVEAIDIANSQYACSNITFSCGDIEHLALREGSFDAVVSIETFEHLDNPIATAWLRKIDALLVPGGVLVLSSPILRFVDGLPYITNPYHVNEKTRDELTSIVGDVFRDYVTHYYHQQEESFLPLLGESSGFCLVIARKKS